MKKITTSAAVEKFLECPKHYKGTLLEELWKEQSQKGATMYEMFVPLLEEAEKALQKKH